MSGICPSQTVDVGCHGCPAAATSSHQQALALQDSQRFSDCHPGHAHTLRKSSFGWKPISWNKQPQGQGALDPLHDGRVCGRRVKRGHEEIVM